MPSRVHYPFYSVTPAHDPSGVDWVSSLISVNDTRGLKRIRRDDDDPDASEKLNSGDDDFCSYLNFGVIRVEM